MLRKLGHGLGRFGLALLDGCARLVPEYYVNARLYELDQEGHDGERELDRTAA